MEDHKMLPLHRRTMSNALPTYQWYNDMKDVIVSNGKGNDFTKHQ